MENTATASASPSTQPSSSDGDCCICLGNIIEMAKAKVCGHVFCFPCIKKWAEIKMQCPLCRQPIESIIHGIVSDTVYEEFHPMPACLIRTGVEEVVRSGVMDAGFILRVRDFIASLAESHGDEAVANFFRGSLVHQ